MRTMPLLICLAIAASAFVPVASACCIHSTRTVAWAEYANLGGDTVCAVVSAPNPAQAGGCDLAVDEAGFFLDVLDSRVALVSFTWNACGDSGVGLGSGFVSVPEGCDTVSVTLGPEATTGVLRRVA